jgi:hypothetical protein
MIGSSPTTQVSLPGKDQPERRLLELVDPGLQLLHSGQRRLGVLLGAVHQGRLIVQPGPQLVGLGKGLPGALLGTLDRGDLLVDHPDQVALALEGDPLGAGVGLHLDPSPLPPVGEAAFQECDPGVLLDQELAEPGDLHHLVDLVELVGQHRRFDGAVDRGPGGEPRRGGRVADQLDDRAIGGRRRRRWCEERRGGVPVQGRPLRPKALGPGGMSLNRHGMNLLLRR